MSALRPASLLALLGFVLSGCPDATAPHPASLAIAPRLATLALGDSAQLSATVTDASGKTLTGAAVSWSSADTTVLSVSATGLARARGPGRTTVSAVAEGAHDTLGVAVTIRFVQVAGGYAGLCALASTGAAYCRGGGMHNASGQLGNGTTVASDTFVAVAGGHRFLTVRPGELATCGLAADSTAWCWGSGSYGALGTGDTVSRTTPAPVAGGLRFVALAVGELHACALTASGAAYCWGYGYFGQNGDSGLANRLVPAPVPGAPPFVAIAAGASSTCGVTAAHTAWCWGDNTSGQLGVVTDTVFQQPVAALGGRTFLTLALRDQYCGLATDGSVHCWAPGGYGFFQQEPADARRYSDLGNAWEHACGVASDSTVYCWGYGSGSRAVTHGTAFTSVTAGDFADCAVSADGTAYCWFPHCGYPEDVACHEPPLQFPVHSARPVTAVSAGPWFNACTLADDGTVSCFYLDFVDYPVRADSSTTPVVVPGGLTFRSVAVGSSYLSPLVPYGDYACGLAADSTAYCWATHDGGNSVPRVTVSAPVAVPGGLKYVSLDTYGNHVCGIAVGGAAYCWKPGDPAPSPVPGGRSFTRVFASWGSDCALDAAGAAFCWGRNDRGQLGLGFRSRQAIEPVQVLGEHPFTVVVPGYEHSCGLTTDGTPFCWGANYNGQLGNGNTTSSTEPVPVAGGLHLRSLATGGEPNCGLDAEGSTYCWGSSLPAPVRKFPGTQLTSLTTGYGLCGTTAAGEVVCSGVTSATARARVQSARPTPRRR